MTLLAALQNRSVVFASAICTVGFLSSYLKQHRQGKKFTDPILATGKRVIITGTTSGIGLETARELAKRKAHVYMACRNMQKCEELADDIIVEAQNKHVYCLECDLSSMESIRKFVEKYKEKEEKLDILINNAGVMRCPRSLTKDGIEMQLGVNHFGHFLLTNLLLDLIKKSAPSRIINVSSSAHHRGQINTTDLNSEKKYNDGDAYSQSKLANVLFTRNLANRLTGTGVTANALDPGLVETDITRHMSVFNGISGWILRPLTWPFLKTPFSGAQTTLYVALDPSLEQVSGLYFSDCAEGKISEEAKNQEISDWLWKVSEKWTGLTSNTNKTK